MICVEIIENPISNLKSNILSESDLLEYLSFSRGDRITIWIKSPSEAIFGEDGFRHESQYKADGRTLSAKSDTQEIIERPREMSVFVVHSARGVGLRRFEFLDHII